MASEPTTTSYAILGLLAVKPWTTYELAQQMTRALGHFWPRAESNLYEEPKKLVALGLARAAPDKVGKRPRTLYSITPKGRPVPPRARAGRGPMGRVGGRGGRGLAGRHPFRRAGLGRPREHRRPERRLSPPSSGEAPDVDRA